MDALVLQIVAIVAARLGLSPNVVQLIVAALPGLIEDLAKLDTDEIESALARAALWLQSNHNDRAPMAKDGPG